MNAPVQGTGADGLKLALARLFADRQAVPDARLIATVHDEILVCCPGETAEQTALWLKVHMEEAMQTILGDAIPVEAEVTIGADWAGGESL